MNIKILMLAIALGAAPLALAAPGGEGGNTNCSGVGNPNSPCEPTDGNGGSSGGQAQGQNQVASSASSGSSSSSVVGDTTSYSEGSQSSSGAVSGGNTLGQETNVDAGGDTNVTVVGDDYDYPVNTAASIFAQNCQSGVSGQGDDFGASAVFSDPLCDSLKVAGVYWDYSQLLLKQGDIEGSAHYKLLFDDEMAQVETLMETTKELAVVDRASGFLIKPLGLLALLLLL